ncbi:MAG: PLP-dependent aminotransferase family protein [Geminicoccaceae bacterium]
MTISIADLDRFGGPRYRALYQALADAITHGRIAPGTRLPPQRQLAYELGVTVHTVGRAYELLALDDVVTGQVGRGTYVRDPDTACGQLVCTSPVEGSVIDLRANRPQLAPVETAFRETLRRMTAAGDMANLVGYAPTAGHAIHREAAARWLGPLGVDTSAEQILLTNGVQQGVSLAMMALARAGDVIMAPKLGYPHFEATCRILHLQRAPVALDGDGLVPDDLERVAKETGARILLVQLNLHNPTSSVTSAERRQRLAALARELDLIVIEDDVYGALLDQPPPPIQTFVPERTVYLTSASKTLAPGLRLGAAVAPQSLLGRMIDTQHYLKVALPPITAEIFRDWVESGQAVELTRLQRREAKARQDLAAKAMAGVAYDAHPSAYHLWVKTGEHRRTSEVLGLLRDQGVLVLDGDMFAFGHSRRVDAFRVSLCGARNHEQLTKALRLVGRALSPETSIAPMVL